jgi:putative endonuclease
MTASSLSPSFPRKRESREYGGYVYILSNKRNGTLYIGVTGNLPRRIWEHKSGAVEGFTLKYGLKTLVYYERFDRIEEAITRETQMKKWYRKWKLELIEKDNPHWDDLYETLN